MKRIATVFVILGSFLHPHFSVGQNEVDALRYSYESPTGTARALGMGGAFSAVGADITAATTNPAGLGLFRHSEAVFTPAFRSIGNTSNYLNNSATSSDQRLSMGNWGFVFHNETYFDDGQQYRPSERGLISYTFAIGQNQLENYQNDYVAGGFNQHSSITDRFAELVQGVDPATFGAVDIGGIAFNSYAIDTLANRDGRTYFPAVNRGRIDQEVRVIESGRKNEWFLGGAVNFNDFLFVGLTIGIQSLRYERTFTYMEEDNQNLHEFFVNDPDDPDFDLETSFRSLTYSETLDTRGTGLNAKLGVIVKPSDVFRVGVSVQTPTYFLLSEEFGNSVSHTLETDNGGLETFTAPDPNNNPATGIFEYNLSTPFKLTAGGMVLFGKNGFISADVELTDFGAARFSSTDASSGESFSAENQEIASLYRSSLNYRVGGELRYNIFRIRAGAGYYMTVLEDEAQEYQNASLQIDRLDDPSRLIFTGGLGIRQPNYFLDVSWVGQQQSDKFNPYGSSSGDFFVPTLINQTTRQSIYLTVGFNI